jgi:AmiR/NasT family two-component response regulator
MMRVKNVAEPAATEPGPAAVVPGEDALTAAQREIALLHEALETSRTVGIAIGILVERHGYAPEVAFDLLVKASQEQGRRVRAVAADLTRTGEFPVDKPTD